MHKSKYEKFIIYDVKPPAPGEKPMPIPKRLQEHREQGNYIDSTWMFALDNKVAEGAFYTNCVWLWEKKGTGDLEMEISHTHDFDETLGFIGTVPGDPRDLGGEIEFWLEDEQFIITRSCLIFIPRGMKHLPLSIKRIDSPIFWWTAGNGTMYTRSSGTDP
ncbi:MAG: hypothetical protein A2Y90_01020 [Chloroflexi bacterium RBG_13_52_12]|nr:MAG: hypothetical protein A2Y90_01020 [Chloroflexi bacterium RBG_13_52_12]